MNFYHEMTTAPTAYENRALLTDRYAYLRVRDTSAPDPRIFAQVKWSEDGDVVFTFHNLWNTQEEWVSQSYFISPDIASQLSIQDGFQYRLVNVFTGQTLMPCRSSADLKWNCTLKCIAPNGCSGCDWKPVSSHSADDFALTVPVENVRTALTNKGIHSCTSSPFLA